MLSETEVASFARFVLALSDVGVSEALIDELIEARSLPVFDLDGAWALSPLVFPTLAGICGTRRVMERVLGFALPSAVLSVDDFVREIIFEVRLVHDFLVALNWGSAEERAVVLEASLVFVEHETVDIYASYMHEVDYINVTI